MSVSSISTMALARQTRNLVRTMQTDMHTLELEIGTGKKSDVAGSVGSRAALLLDLRNARQTTAEYRQSIQTQSSRLTLMQEALDKVRGSATHVRDLALSVSGSGDGAAAATIDEAALNALQTLSSMFNSSQSGRYLFAGTRFDTRPMQPPTEAAPSGVVPLDAVKSVLSSLGPTSTAADVDAALNGPNGLSSLFSDTYGGGPAAPENFSKTFFLGSTTQVKGRAGEDLPVTYACTAGDEPVRTLLKGLYLLAAVPSESVSTEAYQRITDQGWRLITQATDELIDTQGILGLQEELLKRADERHEVEDGLLSKQITQMEMADPYETGLRLNTLETQLEATFAMTSRISKLSLIDFL
ncbi:flagellin [Rhodocista pekingensis]|uniref:Flagellin n=1 Tax=Rhodocista pekingensis TaxID=201185 RepID=A0ABW2L0Y9_9PROT